MRIFLLHVKNFLYVNAVNDVQEIGTNVFFSFRQLKFSLKSASSLRRGFSKSPKVILHEI